ncbi:adenylosuccinate lyase [Streptomyces eurocidicus]|uniref:Adenylosuccinate lyase n=1 Tax=Streptomyces eurocidicus TaxID=66423 RepID=A0A2N8NVI2_STREU|nr:adenylosuccinate lyase [Streptomyces eurocidicus]MBB5122269.1 adenylosuccinate lyase [Streptomyces eurocidicus]MBF6055153.1 adenylosuccinate lyase [Streptomyces eurocidicus]PNE32790.1 adenylosuccinate lyase [Streptomyces eurocidicus]
MIPRYARPEMARLWTDEAKYASWVRVEVLACEAQARLGTMSEADLAAVRSGRAPTPEEVREQERTRDHEILAFLAAYTASIPDDAARWVHYGMTSYDLVDTALGHTLAASADLLLTAAGRLRDVLASRAVEHWDTVCVARTHGIHAEPTTFGQKLAGFAFGVHRSVVRLRAARAAVAVGTISGPVGTYSSVDPFVETYVCEALGLGVEPVPTQVVARDRHAELLSAVAVLGAVVEQIALEMRLLQRTEVREVEEPRSSAYQGSSAMPHKRNPTSSERLCGLARVLRANLGAALENVALWHERDLAHSSVERVVLPDSLIAAHYQVTAAADLVEGLRVFPDRMRANLEATDGLIHSSTVMLRLMADGSEREKAYRSVQDAATETWETGRHLRETLRDRGIVTGEDVYDPTRFLRSRDAMRRRLEELLHVEM